jgi:SAM-dependent methyltransferase
MNEKAIYSDYDDFAWFYNKHWGDRTSNPFSLEILNRLILSRLSPGAKVLDLCCGSGQLDQTLIEMGFQLTGIDGSEKLLEYARRNAPGAEFVHDDARYFSLTPVYEGAVSIFDSLNHIMTPGELGMVFNNTFDALVPGGPFLFDLNMDEAYKAQWKDSNSLVESDHAFIMRFAYNEESRTGRADITMFRLLEGIWHRSDVCLEQRAYSEEEVISALSDCGFSDISAYDVAGDLGVEGVVGRTFFLAHKPTLKLS